jgi:hypothetical protein
MSIAERTEVLEVQVHNSASKLPEHVQRVQAGLHPMAGVAAGADQRGTTPASREHSIRRPSRRMVVQRDLDAEFDVEPLVDIVGRRLGYKNLEALVSGPGESPAGTWLIGGEIIHAIGD